MQVKRDTGTTPHPSILSYNAWFDQEFKHLADSEGDNAMSACPDCLGCGETECDCCGSEVECDRCEGSCEVPTAGIDRKEAKKLFTYRRYRDQLIIDLRAYAKHVGVNVYAFLAEYGIHVYSSLPTKTELHEGEPGMVH